MELKADIVIGALNDASLSSIAAARRAWLDAMRSSDIDRLAAMVIDDIVVIHGNGRCVRGKDELRADFLKAFRSFAIDQKVSEAEVMERGKWAFEVAEVETTLSSPWCKFGFVNRKC